MPYAVHFNPRSPHGERRAEKAKGYAAITFQSTLPAWGATLLDITPMRWACDFNPRSPHGERHQQGIPRMFSRNFNPRSPHGERLA